MSSSRSQCYRGTVALLVLTTSLLLVSPPPSALAAGAAKPIVTRIRKDPDTSLYTVSIRKGAAPLVLDLGGPLVWASCANEVHRRFPCVGSLCQVANRNRPSFCPYNANGRPGSKDKYCTCSNNPYNPVARHCGYGHVTVLTLAANATDGKTPLYPVSFSAFGSCVEDGLLTDFPSGATGVAGLSRSPLSLPLQVASSLKVAKQFALCLPSGGAGDGAAIFGGGPFQLMASPPVEVAEGLRQNPIPLLKNPMNGGYYFRITGIAVNLQRVPVPPGAFDLDARRGTGGATLSTAAPYTALRSDIYRPLRQAFDAATSGIARIKPVRPFDICYQASALSSTSLGWAVANIDLMLDGGRNWTLPGGSSLVQLNGGERVCFAFVEMESTPAPADSPAVVIGGFQMENHLMLFDLEKSTLGLSGLLPGIRTTCSNFNFNMGSS